MNDESKIIYQGPGPFHLPVVQTATATGNKENGVTMTLRALLPEREPQLESVSAQMLSGVARELAVQLLRAADEAEAE